MGKARVSKKSRNALEGRFTFTPLLSTGRDCEVTQRFHMRCIAPSSPGLALTGLRLNKEEAKLSCDAWELIQQDYCWLVTGKCTGIRSCSTRGIRWQLEGSSWEPGCQEDNPTPRFSTQIPILICSIKHSLLGSIAASPNKNRNGNYRFHKVYTHPGSYHHLCLCSCFKIHGADRRPDGVSSEVPQSALSFLENTENGLDRKWEVGIPISSISY